MGVSRPVSIAIPAIDVRSPLVRLGLNPDRTLEVPSDPAKAGWYDGSATPGAAGAAVIAGHVTWDQEPTVFFRLGALRPGQRVQVQRADGRTAVFAVTEVAQYPKDEFPTAEVYGAADRPELRLITCGGRYDSDSSNYEANVVVYAELVGSHR
ncbi:MAG TPA: class F sortase [Nocardioidaceae bacterium]|nr:class F sortase [Nocardioidaceae bacterium]